MPRFALLAATAALLLWELVSSASAAGTLLVGGGTGRTGQEIVRQALAQGYEVRVLSRDAARVKALFGDRVTPIQGDVRDPGSLVAAVEDVRYVISAIGSNSRRDPTNTPEAIDYQGVRALAEAASAAGVQQFVLISSMGVTQITHPLNRFIENILLWKALGENSVRHSGLAYTIIRPGGLTDDPGGTAGFRTGQGDTMAYGRIARADVAAICLAALGNRAAIDKTVEVVADATAPRGELAALFAPLAPDEKGTLRGD